jgi:hypothetical protein
MLKNDNEILTFYKLIYLTNTMMVYNGFKLLSGSILEFNHGATTYLGQDGAPLKS